MNIAAEIRNTRARRQRSINALTRFLQQRDPAAASRVSSLLQRTQQQFGGFAGFGAVDWGSVGANILDTYLTVKASDKLSEQDRKAAELELKKIEEQTAQMKKQLAMQKELTKLATIQESTKLQIAKETALEAVSKNKLLLGVAAALAGVFVWMRSNRSSGGRRRRTA